MSSTLSKMADYLLSALEQETVEQEGKLQVNRLVSKVASLYEKLRNVMDYREEEVVLRAAIERIVKRRLLLGGNGETIAEPLVRELVWARYVSERKINEEKIQKIAERIDLYLKLRKEVLSRGLLKENIVNEWTYHLLSCDIEHTVNPKGIKNIIANIMFAILRKNISILDDSEQTKDAQVFIAVRRSFAKDDIAFLRFHLFNQFYGELSLENVETIGHTFLEGYNEIQKQLNYPLKDKIYSYINSKTPVFFVLEDLVKIHGVSLREIATSEEELGKAVFAACDARYSGIRKKVNRAIIRSVIFILLTKVVVAFAIEGSVENILYGGIDLRAMAFNVAVPPFLMVLVGLFIRTPGKRNSDLIVSYIQSVLLTEDPALGRLLELRLVPEKRRPILDMVFTILWFLAFLLSFGVLIFILSTLHLNPVSQVIFIFFLTIVSFLSYRISLMSKEYSVEKNPGIISPLTDFFFMPIIRVGRDLTEGISQINILLFIFDFIIETPFKGLFAFFEQWFFYLNAKREELE